MTDHIDTLFREAAWLRGLANRLASDPETARDLEQETWLAALEQCPEPRSSLRPWLAATARNLLRRATRSKHVRAFHEERAAGPSEASDGCERLVLTKRLLSAIDDLDQKYRSAITLRYLEGLRSSEIASRLGISDAAARQRMSRALAMLRVRLDADYRGDRKAWSVVALAGGAHNVAVAPAAISIGLLAMSAKYIAAAVVVFLVGLGFYSSNVKRVGSSASHTPFAERSSGRMEHELAVGPDAPVAELPEANRSPVKGAPVVAGSNRISGSVRDQDDEPVAGATVWIVAEENPFEDLTSEHEVRFDNFYGGKFETTEMGTFTADVSHPGRVLVRVPTRPRYVASQEERWVDTPATDLAFVVTRRAICTLAIRAVDLVTHEPLERFRISVSGQAVGFQSQLVEGREAVVEVPVDANATGSELDVEVALLVPVVIEGARQSVRLRPNTRIEIELGSPSDGVIAGRVTDHLGNALNDALVWFGDVELGRGDEPFKPFQPERIHGVRTAADGSFELSGQGDVVSAWHPAASSRTVSRADATAIELEPRGAIRGLFAEANEIVKLDRQQVAVSDESGSFTLEGVEAGVRGLTLGARSRSWIGVRVPPGEIVDVDFSRRVDSVRFEFFSAGKPHAAPKEAFLIGLDDVFTARVLVGAENAAVAELVLPGRYRLYGTQGELVNFTIEPQSEVVLVELGTAVLRVHARPGVTLRLTRSDSDTFERLIAARIARRVPHDGVLVFGPLVEGHYWLSDGRARKSIEIETGHGEEVDVVME